MTDLRKLSEAATPGEWKHSPWHVEEGPDAVRAEAGWIISTSSNGYDCIFTAALVNSYRSGSLIPRSEYERVLALLAEAREALRMVSSGLNNAFAAGTEEREYGSARRQEKAMEKVETTRSTARATLSRIDDALAAEPEARG